MAEIEDEGTHRESPTADAADSVVELCAAGREPRRVEIALEGAGVALKRARGLHGDRPVEGHTVDAGAEATKGRYPWPAPRGRAPI